MVEGNFDKSAPRTDKASLLVQLDWVFSLRVQSLEQESTRVDLVRDWEVFLVADGVLESAEGLILNDGPVSL